jgi:hypothetical protein
MNRRALFADPEEAGHRLAAELAGYAGRRDLLVLALPRGGVPVAFPVRRRAAGRAGGSQAGGARPPGAGDGGAIAAGVVVVEPGVIEALRVPP